MTEYLDRFYQLFYYENISEFKTELEKYCAVLENKIDCVKSNEKTLYTVYTLFDIYNENSQQGTIAKFNIYYDGTIKLINLNYDKLSKIPTLNKETLNVYRMTQDELSSIHNKILEILTYLNNSDKIINYIYHVYSNYFYKCECSNYNGRIVYRFKPGYCFEINKYGLRVLYSSKPIHNFQVNSNLKSENFIHPQLDDKYNKPY